MKMIELPNVRALGELMLRVSQKEKLTITAVLFYEEAEALLHFFMQRKNVTAWLIELEHPEFGYDREYYVTIWDDGLFTIERAYDDGRGHYIKMPCADAMFFDGDAKSKIALINEDASKFELDIHDTDFDMDFTSSCSPYVIDNIDYTNFTYPLTWN